MEKNKLNKAPKASGTANKAKKRPTLVNNATWRKAKLNTDKPSFSKNVILFGATGLIGSAICHTLAKNGYHLTIAINKTFPPKDVTSLPHVQVKHSKGFAIDHLKKLIDKKEVVINLAGESIANGRWTADKKKRILESRTSTTSALVNAINLLKKPPELLLNASAIGYYGTTQRATVDEMSPKGSDFMANVCHLWEISANRASKKTRVVSMRIGIVLSSKAGAFAELLPHFRLGLGGVMGDGGQGFPWVHIEDVAGITNHIIEQKTLKGPVNITAPQLISFKTFTSILAKTLARPSFFTKPAWLIKLLVGSEKSGLILQGNFVSPKKLIATKYSFFHSKIDTAIAHLLKND